ncbi:MAG: hypothetical protein V4543_06775 [Bacteroidota bacterium]
MNFRILTALFGVLLLFNSCTSISEDIGPLARLTKPADGKEPLEGCWYITGFSNFNCPSCQYSSDNALIKSGDITEQLCFTKVTNTGKYNCITTGMYRNAEDCSALYEWQVENPCYLTGTDLMYYQNDVQSISSSGSRYRYGCNWDNVVHIAIKGDTMTEDRYSATCANTISYTLKYVRR